MKDCSLWLGGWRVSPWRNCAGSSGFRAKPATKSSIATRNAGFTGSRTEAGVPYRYANQLPFQVENYILNVRREHPSWGARKIRERLTRRFPNIPLPAKSSIHALLDRHGLVERRGRLRRRAQGTPLGGTAAQ